MRKVRIREWRLREAEIGRQILQGLGGRYEDIGFHPYETGSYWKSDRLDVSLKAYAGYHFETRPVIWAEQGD